MQKGRIGAFRSQLRTNYLLMGCLNSLNVDRNWKLEITSHEILGMDSWRWQGQSSRKRSKPFFCTTVGGEEGGGVTAICHSFRFREQDKFMFGVKPSMLL